MEALIDGKMNVKDVKFRCSSLGKIMTDGDGGITETQLKRIDELVLRNQEYHGGNAKKKLTPIMEEELVDLIKKRSAPVPLGKTCITHLVEVYIGLRYERKKEIISRYIDKGLAVEEDSFTLVSLVKSFLFRKNKKWFNHDPDITGTPDHIPAEETTVDDIKSSWDIFTFLAVTLVALNKMYYWQLQGYMILTGRKLSRLIYCLTDTPPIMLEDQKRRLGWKLGIIDPDPSVNPDYAEACAEIDRLGKYDDIPMNERIKEIEVPFDPKAEKKIRERVKRCRLWLLTTYPDFFYTDDLSLLNAAA